MAKLLWAIACQRAIVSAQNTLTLVDTLDEVQIPAAPPKELTAPGAPVLMVPMRFAIVALWERSTVDEATLTEARMRFFSPKGKKIGETMLRIDLVSAPRCRTIAEAPALPYHGPGDYKFRFDVRDGADARWRPVGTPVRFSLRIVAPTTTQ